MRQASVMRILWSPLGAWGWIPSTYIDRRVSTLHVYLVVSNIEGPERVRVARRGAGDTSLQISAARIGWVKCKCAFCRVGQERLPSGKKAKLW